MDDRNETTREEANTGRHDIQEWPRPVFPNLRETAAR
jgi:hypothetical protein